MLSLTMYKLVPPEDLEVPGDRELPEVLLHDLGGASSALSYLLSQRGSYLRSTQVRACDDGA